MNYRHAYHAGNFADVFKHAIMARIITYLNLKETAYHYIDTHAGIGLYNLQSDEAKRTGEWREGVALLQADALPDTLQVLFDPYLNTALELQKGEPNLYPGSPYLAQSLMREQDRLTFCELHKEDARLLERNFSNDKRCKSLEIDGFKALKSALPPKERRGLVLIDPPFELTTEFEDIVAAIEIAYRKWATGIFCIWYPIKGTQKVDAFVEALKATRIPKILRLELLIDNPKNADILSGSGLIIINPPWTLKTEAEAMLSYLSQLLGRDGKGRWRSQWLTPK